MESLRERKILLTVLIPLTGILTIYGLTSPIPGSTSGALVLVLLSTVLALGVRAAETHDPHQLNLVQKKSYRITLRSVVATSFLTGIALLALLYGTAAVIGVVTAFSGVETLSFQVFAEAVGRLQFVLGAPTAQLLWAYTGIAVAMGIGFWTLFPYLPTDDEEIAGPIAFAATGVFLLSAASMFVHVPVSEPASLALDAAIIAFWGHFFAVAYEDVERYVP